MVWGVLVVTLGGLEGGVLRCGLLNGAFLDEFVGHFLVLQFGVQLRLEDLGLDVTGVVLEARFLRHAEEVLLEFGVVHEVAFAAPGDEVLVHAGGRRAVLVIGLDFFFLLVGESLQLSN